MKSNLIKKIVGLFCGTKPNLPPGNFGEIREKYIYCSFWKQWIGVVVPCMEICDERGDYLRLIEQQRIEYIPNNRTFNAAAMHAGFDLPADVVQAIKLCLFCEIHSGKGKGVTFIPPLNTLSLADLTKQLYG